MASDRKKEKRSGIFERFSSNRRESVSEDEIRELVDDNVELDDEEKRMINEIIDLGDMCAGEISTPRVDVMLVQDDETARAALDRMRGTGYSRLPVCHDSIDDIIGVVNIKDLIGPLMDDSMDDSVVKYMYEPMFVPETKNVISLLGEMQAAHQQMAIVVDEYGGTEGVITIEDIVEEIVGEIADESDVQGDLVVQTGQDCWRVDGRMPIEDAESLGWPVHADDDTETIAGWMINKMDSVPDAGDVLQEEDYTFKVEKMRRSRISSIKVERIGNAADLQQ